MAMLHRTTEHNLARPASLLQAAAQELLRMVMLPRTSGHAYRSHASLLLDAALLLIIVLLYRTTVHTTGCHVSFASCRSGAVRHVCTAPEHRTHSWKP